MSTATIFVGSAALRARWPLPTAALMSLLLHAVLAWWLLHTPWQRDLPAEPPTMVIEVVRAPEPAPLPAPPPPPEPTTPPTALIPPPPPPQLEDAPLAERSSPPPVPRPSPQPARPRPETPAPTASPRSVPALPRADDGQSAPFEAGRATPDGGPKEETATQAVQDFILAQIARHWIIDVRSTRFNNIVLNGRFVLLPNGMLAPPFGRNDPWDPQRMVRGYDQLLKPGNEALRTAIETFIQAARLAQPFRLPPDGKADEPRHLPLSFRLGDL